MDQAYDGMIVVSWDVAQTTHASVVAIVEPARDGPDPLLPVWMVSRLHAFPTGTPYTVQARRVADIVASIADQGLTPVLVADGTGLGRPVVEMLRDALTVACPLFGVLWTTGKRPKLEYPWLYVPRSRIIERLRSELDHGRVLWAADLDNGRALAGELMAFREGAHLGDHAAAVAQGLWVGGWWARSAHLSANAFPHWGKPSRRKSREKPPPNEPGEPSRLPVLARWAWWRRPGEQQPRPGDGLPMVRPPATAALPVLAPGVRADMIGICYMLDERGRPAILTRVGVLLKPNDGRGPFRLLDQYTMDPGLSADELTETLTEVIEMSRGECRRGRVAVYALLNGWGEPSMRSLSMTIYKRLARPSWGRSVQYRPWTVCDSRATVKTGMARPWARVDMVDELHLVMERDGLVLGSDSHAEMMIKEVVSYTAGLPKQSEVMPGDVRRRPGDETVLSLAAACSAADHLMRQDGAPALGKWERVHLDAGERQRLRMSSKRMWERAMRARRRAAATADLFGRDSETVQTLLAAAERDEQLSTWDDQIAHSGWVMRPPGGDQDGWSYRG